MYKTQFNEGTKKSARIEITLNMKLIFELLDSHNIKLARNLEEIIMEALRIDKRYYFPSTKLIDDKLYE